MGIVRICTASGVACIALRSPAIVLAFFAWSPLAVLARAERAENALCRGTVVDAEGLPVSNATVVAVGLYPQASPPHESLGSLSTVTTDDGTFALQIMRTDSVFLQQEAFLLGVSASGKRSQVQLVSHVRCLAGAPLNIVLSNEKPTRLQISSLDGKAVENAQVSPARFGEQVLPYGIDWRGNNTNADRTDASGMILVSGTAPSQLTMVYVESERIGRQCIRVVRAASGQLQAVVMPTSVESGKLEVAAKPDFVDVDLSDLQLTFVSREIDAPDSQYTWCEADVTEDGTFSGCRLSAGTVEPRGIFPDDFPYAFDRSDLYRFRRTESGETLQLKLHPAIRVDGRITAEGSNEPIPHISIQHFATDGRLTVTDHEGRFSFWTGPDRIAYLPYDAWQQFTLRDGSFLYPQSVPENGVLRLDDRPMQPVSQASGRTIDEHGNMIAGARISCEYKPDNALVYRKQLYSDEEGRVRFDGIPSGARVTLTASTERRRTEQSISVLAIEGTDVELVLRPRHPVRLTGVVVDESDKPISGAQVRARKASLLREEGYQGVSRQAESLFDANVLIETDSKGRFASPPILDWDQEISLEIHAPGFRTFRNYWRDASQAGAAEENLDFSKLKLRRESPVMSRELTVVDDQTGSPIAGARIALLGAVPGLTKGITDGEGRCSLAVRDGLQVLGIWKEGYAPVLQTVETGNLNHEWRLGRDVGEHAGATHTQTDRMIAARQLNDLIPYPGPDDTVNRQSQYFFGVGLSDLDLAMKMLEAHPLKGHLSRYLIRRPWLNKEQLTELREVVDHESAFHILLMQLRREKDATTRSDLIDEVVAFRGGDPLFYTAQAADAILASGETDRAIKLLENVWDAHPQLADAIATGNRIQMIKETRGIAPMYAIVNPASALELIRIGARSNEIAELRSKAFVYMTVYAPQRSMEITRLFSDDRVTADGLRQFSEFPPLTDLSTGLKVLGKLRSSPAKAEYLLTLAGNLSDRESAVRDLLCREALSMLFLGYDGDRTRESPSRIAAKGARLVGSFDPGLAEQFAFAAIWNCEGKRVVMPFATECSLAEELAFYDASLARAIVEPCFNDWSWLFDDMDGSPNFSSNPPLRAAGSIDPQWAITQVRSLLDGELKPHIDRQYEIVGAVTNRLNEVSD